MTTEHHPPPEAVLITQRIEALVPQPSRSRLAREAGISPALWAKIEKGYDQPADGIRVPYKGSARAVAAMASVLGITPAELRKCKRGDAARILAALPPPGPEPASPGWEEVNLRLERMEQNLERLLSERRPREDEGNGHTNGGSRRAG